MCDVRCSRRRPSGRIWRPLSARDDSAPCWRSSSHCVAATWRRWLDRHHELVYISSSSSRQPCHHVIRDDYTPATTYSTALSVRRSTTDSDGFDYVLIRRDAALPPTSATVTSDARRYTCTRQLSSSLRITGRSFRYASPCLWNQLPSSLRQPHLSPSVSVLPVHAPTTSSHTVNSPLSPSITPSLFHSRLKTSFTDLSHHRLPSSLRTDSTDFTTGPFLLSISVFCF